MSAVLPEPAVNEAVHARPAVGLRAYVAAYHGYRQRGLLPAQHRGLPSPFLTLIFTLDEPLRISQHVDPRQRPGDYRTLLGGLHTSPALIQHDGAQSGIQLLVRPLGARVLLGLPPGELTGLDLEADDVLGADAVEIHERLRQAATWPDRFAVLDVALQRRLSRAGRGWVSPEVERAWQLLLATRGAAPVASLAAEVGWSDRHLGVRFRSEVGLTPKAAARVVRFHHARCRLQTSRPAPGRLATVAAECGYFDQAHLAREFNALAGCPPSRWIAEEVGNIQVAPVPDGADFRP